MVWVFRAIHEEINEIVHLKTGPLLASSLKRSARQRSYGMRIRGEEKKEKCFCRGVSLSHLDESIKGRVLPFPSLPWNKDFLFGTSYPRRISVYVRTLFMTHESHAKFWNWFQWRQILIMSNRYYQGNEERHFHAQDACIWKIRFTPQILIWCIMGEGQSDICYCFAVNMENYRPH